MMNPKLPPSKYSYDMILSRYSRILRLVILFYLSIRCFDRRQYVRLMERLKKLLFCSYFGFPSGKLATKWPVIFCIIFFFFWLMNRSMIDYNTHKHTHIHTEREGERERERNFIENLIMMLIQCYMSMKEMLNQSKIYVDNAQLVQTT